MNNSSELTRLTSEFLTEAAKIVIESIHKNPIAFALATKDIHVIKNGGSLIFKQPEYGKLVDSLKDPISKLDEYQKLLSFIKQEVKSFHDDPDELQDLVMLVLIRFLDVSNLPIVGQEPEKQKPNHLSNLIRELHAFLYEDRVEFVELIPLANFKSSINEFIADDRTRVRPITSEERNYFLNQTIDYDFMDTQTYEFLIEITRETEKGGFGRSIGMTLETSNIISAVLTSFRIIADGSVSHEYIFTRYKLGLMGFRAHVSRNIYVRHHDAYSFDSTYLPKFRRIYDFILNLQNNPNPSVIRIAIDRFNLIYERKLKVDAVIDLAIAFEILFSKKKDLKESITFKLGIRAGNLLGRNKEGRENIFNVISKFYKVRSKLVHGRKASLNDSDNRYVEEARIILRLL